MSEPLLCRTTILSCHLRVVLHHSWTPLIWDTNVDAGVEVADRLFCVEDEAANSAIRADSIIDSVGNFKEVYHNPPRAAVTRLTCHTRMTLCSLWSQLQHPSCIFGAGAIPINVPSLHDTLLLLSDFHPPLQSLFNCHIVLIYKLSCYFDTVFLRFVF